MKTYLVYEVPEVGKKNNYTDIDTFDKQWGSALKSDDSLPKVMQYPAQMTIFIVLVMLVYHQVKKCIFMLLYRVIM